MSVVPLLAAAFNWFGSVAGFLAVLRNRPRPAGGPEGELFPLFVAGTAAVFGPRYLYLFLEPEYVAPFLVFGAALKTWAFVIAVVLADLSRLERGMLLSFGGGNGVLALLFWIYLATSAG